MKRKNSLMKPCRKWLSWDCSGFLSPINTVARKWITFLISLRLKRSPGLMDHMPPPLLLRTHWALDRFIISVMRNKKRNICRSFAAERRSGGSGLTEPNAGSDSGNTQTNAVLDGNEWVINGSKIFITNAATDITLPESTVLARTGVRDDGKPELSCIIVESGTPGFTAKEMHGKLMWRASNTSELYFEDCRVPKENLLGPRGQGFHQMMKTLDGGRSIHRCHGPWGCSGLP